VSLKGSTVAWTGEQVAIPREGVRGYQVREFSRRRTVLATIAAVAGLALIAVALTIVGGGNGRGIDPGGCEPNCNPT
jgi:hypothetical protein